MARPKKRNRSIHVKIDALTRQQLRTTAQLGKDLRMPPATIRGWRKRHGLGVRLGRKVYFSKEDAEFIRFYSEDRKPRSNFSKQIEQELLGGKKKKPRFQEVTDSTAGSDEFRIVREDLRSGKLQVVESEREVIFLRKDVRKEALRQAAAVNLSLSQYVQLLVFNFAGAEWREGLRPPLQF